MDPIWLARNISTSWRYRASFSDFTRRLRFTYDRQAPGAAPRQWEIGFRYPKPVGAIRLALRGNKGADNFIHSEVFEHLYYNLGLKQAPATILDLGANVGLTAVYFAREFPNAEIACVEPIPANLDLLKRNVALNGIKARVFEAAVGETDGEIVMQLDAKDFGHKVATGDASGDCLTTASISVPSIMKAMGWSRIGLMKMDIEGHEKVLFSSPTPWLNDVDVLCIECHDGFGEPDLQRIAATYGFDPPRALPGIWLLTRPTAN
jgi:FkbM family methyltransferase